MSHRVTLQAFLHQPQENVLADVEFLAAHGGKLETHPDTAHVRFHGALDDAELASLTTWCTKTAEAEAGSGAVVLVVDDEEPDKLEWHTPGENRRHWLEELKESSETFLSEFHHLMHW